MENKKVYIIIIIILAVYLSLILLLGKKQSSENKNSLIVFNDSTVLKSYDDNLEYIDRIENIDKYKFNIYDYNEYIGQYSINYIDGKYRVFDDNNVLVKFKNDMIAVYSDKIKLNTSPIENTDYNDNLVIKKVLEKENIKIPEKYTKSNKRRININNYNNMYIYNINYSTILDGNNDEYFSILFVSNGEKNYIINKSIVQQDKYIELKSFYVNALVDIDNDGTDEIVIDTLSFSQMQGKKKSIHKLLNNEYQELKINTKE